MPRSEAVTVAVNYYCEGEILFNVPRDSFMPPPNVDSAVIKLNIRTNPPVTVADEKRFFRLVKACFAQRRKTLVNTLMSLGGTQYDTKEKLTSLMTEMFGKPTVRGEELSTQQFVELAERLYQ